jgi:unsaturated chondroitin disaccharide hydrolase
VRDEGISQADIHWVLGKIDAVLEKWTHRFPAPTSRGLVYPDTDNVDWTPGFWTGILWLAYEASGEKRYRTTAEVQVESFRRRIEKRVDIETHDLGFLYTLSCVSAYRLTGEDTPKLAALKAADLLRARYLDRAGIVQAWGNPDDPSQRGRMIVDCLMNLPLLYWAAGITSDNKYSDPARSHARQSARYLVRADASTFHTFFMDAESGAPLRGKTAQGLSDDSCWARGQAWAIYGFALSYRYTGIGLFVDIARKTADYFLNRLPDDGICYWDLSFIEGAEERDSSAAAIAACGLLELERQMPSSDPNKRLYRDAAVKIVRSLREDYTTAAFHPESNGILLHAVYSKPDGKGVDECCIWGDYFYLEALVRLTMDWRSFW